MASAKDSDIYAYARFIVACTARSDSTLGTGAQQSVATPPPDVAAPPADGEDPTGLASKVITPGTGKTHPGKSDIVTVHYTGWKTDGSMFDSSVLRGKPSSFPLDRVIAGWTEGVQLMVEGEKRRFWIPEALAYKGAREPKGMLVFDVELLSILGTPADVKAPPADAKRTASGISYKVLKPGNGGKHPTANNTVTVNYSG
jgi:peptidylprolyl isomerase